MAPDEGHIKISERLKTDQETIPSTTQKTEAQITLPKIWSRSLRLRKGPPFRVGLSVLRFVCVRKGCVGGLDVLYSSSPSLSTVC